MFLFLGDETNATQSKQSRFFIYGGLILDAEKCADASAKMSAIRQKYDFSAEHEFKFDTRSRPSHLSISEFLSAKNEVLDLCQELGVRFMAYVVHHDIAADQGLDTWLWALKTLLCQFDLFLQREKSHGMCLVDKFDNDFTVLKGIHQKGVDPSFWGGRLQHHLENVWCYGTVSIGSTHITSMVDIVLGAFRYCVNEITKKTVPAQLYGKVRPLMLCEDGDPGKIDEWGLFLRPKEIKVASYKRDYDSLLEHLRSLE